MKGQGVSVQPAWFKKNIGDTAEPQSVIVSDALVHYQHWPEHGKPGLVFVHGHGAHSHWWDFIAPAFRQSYDVVAIDLSGSGDSDHRQRYSAKTFALEISSVCEHAGLIKPVVVGHSFGGTITRIAAHLYPELVHSIVLVDSVIPASTGSRTPPAMPRHKVRTYKTRAEGMRRFRLRPPQPCKNDYVIEHIASHSLRETSEGFVFKLDQAVFARMEASPLPDAQTMVTSLGNPVGFIYGMNSRFFPENVIDQLGSIIDDELLIPVPDAHHHVFLDQPLVFIEALELILERPRH